VRLLDLFAGIGGFSLAAHWMGWETVAFVEKEPFCQKVLAKNFPGVPIYDDVRTFPGESFRGRCDIIIRASLVNDQHFGLSYAELSAKYDLDTQS
jgi:site-specific DNA-cytosine methylase